MIIAILCFLFILSYVRHTRQPDAGGKGHKEVIDFLLAAAGYGLSFLFVDRICSLIGADFPAPVLLVLAVVPGVLCVLASVWTLTRRSGSHEARLSESEALAVVALFSRYRAVIMDHRDEMKGDIAECGSDHLIKLCDEVLANHQRYPFDKLSRWMGFVQGVLASQGLISVEEERNYSRPLLHAIHKRKPPTYP